MPRNYALKELPRSFQLRDYILFEQDLKHFLINDEIGFDFYPFAVFVEINQDTKNTSSHFIRPYKVCVLQTKDPYNPNHMTYDEIMDYGNGKYSYYDKILQMQLD